MSGADEIVLTVGEITSESRDHVLRLLGAWGVLSDLSFSDLLLVTPQATATGVAFEVIGQVRPATSATLVRSDLVGESLQVADWPAIAHALANGQTEWGLANLSSLNPAPQMSVGESETGEVPVVSQEARLECVPVRCGATVSAVLVRVSATEERRRPGRLERTYHQLYQRLAAMVAAGSFPFAGEEAPAEDAPRVGDGLVVVDTEGMIKFASPNAMSALHRMGVTSSVDNRSLSDLGVEEGAVARALSTGRPVIEEAERRPDVVVLVQCVPLLDGYNVTGGMVLLRDVTDLRRLDRLLLTKDAAIREVHHRVKNNLQTISSLLRLQARRLDPGEAQQALKEAERRVRSIALVHEILSRDPGEEVPFSEIVVSLVRMAEDSVVGPRTIQIHVRGDLGDVSAAVATPLAVVIAELLQNAVEHGFPTDDGDDEGSGREVDGPPGGGPEGGGPEGDASEMSAEEIAIDIGHVDLLLSHERRALQIGVHDDGVGLPPGFDIDATTSLGLSIVRDLITSQLGGTMSMGSFGGTVVDIRVPLGSSDSEEAW